MNNLDFWPPLYSPRKYFQTKTSKKKKKTTPCMLYYKLYTNVDTPLLYKFHSETEIFLKNGVKN